ncbi:cytochrome P450 [Sphingomonas daechungensis]|uniref:Cytochrome P450 n=1 Tax=Sphingomonas daechungensis TaxID=1176646 RepID=A0ABX6SXR5_9SPHN|nr:cytochrome P450 [Sphingomonas daechungensis]QNP42386.1 cytochrome P450 [Sphingomonas daechungensis]
MNAPNLNLAVTRPDPVRLRPDFPTVSRDRLAGIPGRKGLPFLGVLPEAVSNPYAFSKAMYERFGPIHRFYACGNWNVQLVGPEANEFVLFDRDANFSAFGGWQPVFGRHFDGGLLLRDGDDHRWHRKLIASAFKQDQLQSYLSTFAGNIAQLAPGASTPVLEAYEFAQQLTFANGYSAFLGRDARDATRNDLLAFRYMMRSATAVSPWALPGTAHARANWAKRHIARLLEPLFDTEPSPERTDLAAALVRMYRSGLLDRREVLAHLTFTIAASFDALSSGTVSTLHYLSRDLQWQARVRDELCAAIPSPAAITIVQLQACQLSEWAFKEALRLNAAAPVLWRRAVRDVEFEGTRCPPARSSASTPC